MSTSDTIIDGNSAAAVLTGVELPSSIWQALVRGSRGRCPRCGHARLFERFLKPGATCASCSQNWSGQQADDFPAYLAIIISGHLMAPVIIGLVSHTNLSPTMIGVTLISLTGILTVALLQPAKGAVIAMQWWLGMHGFKRERRLVPEPE